MWSACYWEADWGKNCEQNVILAKGPQGWLNTSSAFLGSVFCLCIWLRCSEFNFPNWKKPVLKSHGWCRQMYSLREMSLRMTRNPVEVEWGYGCVMDQAQEEGLGVPQYAGRMIHSVSFHNSQTQEVCLWSVKYKDSVGVCLLGYCFQVSKSWSPHQN